ncbi:hypothetical protein DV735_g3731, partial [Chaetothyriales sp. CBS 134920]
MAAYEAGGRTPQILFVDAYDSFSENVVALLRQLLKERKTNVSSLRRSLRSYDAIVIGPGPGSPDSSADTGRLDEIWKDAAENQIPVLGICLGFQSLCSRYGLSVTQFEMPCHGHTKRILHRDLDVFKGVGEIIATNYNSLGVRAKFPIDGSSSSQENVFAQDKDQGSPLPVTELKLLAGKAEFAVEATPEGTLMALEDAFSSILVSGGAEEVPFWGGLIGYLSYEAGLDITMPCHQHPGSSEEPRTLPNLSLMWVERSIVHDKETGRIWVQSLREGDTEWIDDMVAKLQSETGPVWDTSAATGSSSVDVVAPLSITDANLPGHSSYVSAIRSCQSQLHAGNSYELCLTTEATVKSSAPPDALYASLQAVNGALYSAYLRLDRTTILSCSPEQFLSWNRSDPQLDMTPMKGTVAKGPGVTRQQAQKLLRTPKEEAENLMIVDLIRHDLHRALGPHGRVEVKSLYELVETENTYQLISHIRGHVPLAESNVDDDPESHPDNDVDQRHRQRNKSRQIMHYGHKTLRVALPPGSMTGAPKIRSCSLLAGLEQRHRGVYSGVIGYFDIGGAGCWSVAIRCAFSHASEDELVNSGSGGTLRTWHIGAGLWCGY